MGKCICCSNDGGEKCTLTTTQIIQINAMLSARIDGMNHGMNSANGQQIRPALDDGPPSMMTALLGQRLSKDAQAKLVETFQRFQGEWALDTDEEYEDFDEEEAMMLNDGQHHRRGPCVNCDDTYGECYNCTDY